MKKLYPLLIGFAAYTQYHAQSAGIGINTLNPHPSAQMEVSSDNKGFLIPRLTTASINALSSTAAEGLVVYDKEQHKFFGWDGTKWQNLGYEEQNTAPYATNVNITGNAFVGANLTGTYTYNDADANPENGSVYTWKRADDNTGLNVAVISSATTKNYTATSADEGKFLQFCVVPKSNIGISPGNQVCSAWFGAILPNTAPVANNLSVTGQFAPNGVVTGSYVYADAESDAQNTSASGTTYQWKIADDPSGSNLANAAGPNSSGATLGTNKSYTVQTSEAGKYIQYCVKPIANSGTNPGVETCSPLTEISAVALLTGTIASENFDTGAYSTGAGTFNFTGSGTTFVTGSGLYPASPKYASANYGLQVSNATGTITSGTINASAYTSNITLSLRLASFSGTSGNGADASDIVTVAIDTGSGYSSEITVAGNSNARWDFGDTSVATTVFDGNNSATATIGPKGTVTITGIPNTIKGIKITMLNNDTAEMWVVDNVKLTAQLF